MLLIDSLYVNNGGGKILLDYLVAEIEKNEIEAFYLFDFRCKTSYGNVPRNRKLFMKATLRNRFKFYNAHKHIISKVLCFGNLPPSMRLTAKVYTYFHQPMYLDVPKEFSLIEQLKFKLKIAIVKLTAKNSNFWLVQSNVIKERVQSKFHVKSESVSILPFYPRFETLEGTIVRELNTYLYVSNGTPHKNHKRLINVFCEFYDKYQKGKLIFTVNREFSEVFELIQNKIEQGYPIDNIGFVDRLTLQKKYMSSVFLIFPSLTESFGLGLIEAVECGCLVIAADLPYTHEVCIPTLQFDPLDSKSIFNALENSLTVENLQPSIPIIANNIDKLINLLR